MNAARRKQIAATMQSAIEAFDSAHDDLDAIDVNAITASLEEVQS